MNKLLIVGLGNPGDIYQKTRHNIGFEILDYLAQTKQLIFKIQKYGELCEFKLKGRRVYLLKPLTFMNLSGQAIRYHLQYNKISIDNLLIISDDLHIPFGTIKLRRRGSDGGHNGHKDIIAKLETDNYCRLKFGIGSEFKEGQQSNYVLDKWTSLELNSLNSLILESSKAVLNFCHLGIDDTMKKFN